MALAVQAVSLVQGSREFHVKAMSLGQGSREFHVKAMSLSVVFTNTWISPAPSTWSMPASWSLGHVPTAGEDVIFDASGLGNCTLTADISVLSITNQGDYTGTLTAATFNLEAAITWKAGKITAASGNWTLRGMDFVSNDAQTQINSGAVVMVCDGDWVNLLNSSGGGWFSSGGSLTLTGANKQYAISFPTYRAIFQYPPTTINGSYTVSSVSYPTTGDTDVIINGVLTINSVLYVGTTGPASLNVSATGNVLGGTVAVFQGTNATIGTMGIFSSNVSQEGASKLTLNSGNYTGSVALAVSVLIGDIQISGNLDAVLPASIDTSQLTSLTLAGNVNLAGATWTRGSETITLTGSSGTQTIDFGGQTVNGNFVPNEIGNLIENTTGAAKQITNNINCLSFKRQAGALDLNHKTITADDPANGFIDLLGSDWITNVFGGGFVCGGNGVSHITGNSPSSRLNLDGGGTNWVYTISKTPIVTNTRARNSDASAGAAVPFSPSNDVDGTDLNWVTLAPGASTTWDDFRVDCRITPLLVASATFNPPALREAERIPLPILVASATIFSPPLREVERLEVTAGTASAALNPGDIAEGGRIESSLLLPLSLLTPASALESERIEAAAGLAGALASLAAPAILESDKAGMPALFSVATVFSPPLRESERIEVGNLQSQAAIFSSSIQERERVGVNTFGVVPSGLTVPGIREGERLESSTSIPQATIFAPAMAETERLGMTMTGASANFTPPGICEGEIVATNAPTQCGLDTFSGPTGGDLSAHMPEAGGPWIEHPSYAGGAAIITATNKVRPGVAAQTALYYLSVAHDSAEYDVSADAQVLTGVSAFAGVAGRIDPTANTYYYADLTNDIPAVVQLWKVVNGVPTLLGDTAGTLTGGILGIVGELLAALFALLGEGPASAVIHRLKLQIRDGVKKVFLDGVEAISSTDNSIPAAGRAGLLLSDTLPVLTDLTTLANLDNFLVDCVTPPLLVPGAAVFAPAIAERSRIGPPVLPSFVGNFAPPGITENSRLGTSPATFVTGIFPPPLRETERIGPPSSAAAVAAAPPSLREGEHLASSLVASVAAVAPPDLREGERRPSAVSTATAPLAAPTLRETVQIAAVTASPFRLLRPPALTEDRGTSRPFFTLQVGLLVPPAIGGTRRLPAARLAFTLTLTPSAIVEARDFSAAHALFSTCQMHPDYFSAPIFGPIFVAVF